MTQRQYKGTDAQMLMASSQIAERGIEHVDILSARRPQWKSPFFLDLKSRISTAFDKNIGLDILSQIKEATATVTDTIATAHRGIMDLKVEIEVGFRKNPTRMDALLILLGYNKLPKKNTTQAGYVNMLQTLKSNLTPEVKTELVQAGANPTAIDTLLQQAVQLIEANDRQESLKVNRKTVTSVNVEELNDIYDEVISVCKLVSTYFADNKVLVDQFNFTNALKAQGYVPSVKKTNPTTPPTK